MKYWISKFDNRREYKNSSQEIPLPSLEPGRANAPLTLSTMTEHSESDIILGSCALRIDKVVGGDWDEAVLFIERKDVSVLIDFFVQDPEIFAELSEKVFARAHQIIKGVK